MSDSAPIVKVRPRVTPTELQFWWLPPQGMWVTVGFNGANTVCIAKSTDGLTWTNSTNNPFSAGTAYGIAWNGTYWVAVGANTGGTVCIAKSTDGMTWTNSTDNPFSGGTGGRGISWNGTYWVAVGSDGGTVSIAKSTDGMTWVDSSGGGGNNPFSGGGSAGYGIAWNGSYWVAVGNNEGNTVCIAKSTDGMTWTNATDNPFSGSGGEAHGIAWNGSYWVAVGLNSAQTVCIAKSTDGLIWTNSTNNPFSGGVGNGIAWNGSYWVAVGNNTAQPATIAKSTDGLIWTNATDNPFSGGQGRGISWNGSYWVAVGNIADTTVSIAKSTDGMTWTNSTDNPFSGGQGLGIANNFVTGYVLESVSPAITQTVGISPTTATVSGLTNLTDYSFTIKSNSGYSYSSTVPFRTVRTSEKPGPVSTLSQSQSIVGGLLTVTFSWTNPGDYATYYVYGLRTATGTRDTIYKGTSEYGTLSYTFTGLDPVRAYKFNIQRGNDAGYSTKTSVTTTAVPFDPTTVTGLYFWADATDVSGNGATVADGSVIGTWKDKSGTSNNATATTGATVQTDSVGRYLNFTGSSWYSLAQSSWAYNQYFTFFVVDKPVNYAGSYTLISNQASSTDSLIITYNTADGIRLSTTGDNAALGNAFQSVTAPVNIWCFTNYGGKTAYWNKLISGKAPTPAAFITDSLLSIGAVQGATNLYNGRMREILMYSGIMSDSNREAVTTYLYNKWFTQPNLIPLTPVANSTILWLDAQDRTTFFQDLSGTVAVTGNNQTVLRWTDKSGFGNDIECTGGTTAKYYTSQLNNLPVFDTNSAGGTIQTNNFLQTGDATLFLVADKVDAVDYYFKHDIRNNFGLTQTATGNIISWRQSATYNNNQFGDTAVPFIFYGKMQKGQLLSGTFIRSTGIQTKYTVDTLALTVSAAPIKLNPDTSVNYGELIYYNRALTDAEIQTNAAYLSNKWRITIPTAVTFAPQQISGMKLWLDASDPYTLLQGGGVVTLWKDKSGNGNNAVPSGSPTINNGVVFNGSSQWLSLPDSSLPQENYSYYIVSKITGNSAIINAGSKDISGQMWVATAQNGQTAISFSGLTWINTVNTFAGGAARGIAWNGSYWLAVGNDSGNTFSIVKSTNGFTWTNATDNPFTISGYGVAWNSSYWVAVGANSGATVAIAKSTDGMTWTNATNNPFSGGYGSGIAWNGSYWVAVGNNTDQTVTIAKSTDGLIWTDASNNPFSGGYGRGVAWNGSYWVAVGNSVDFTVCIAKSTDGLTWTNSTNNPFSGSSARGIAWNGSYWVAVGNNTGGTVTIAKSTDGLIWTNATDNPFSGGVGYGIAWNGSYWTAVGGNGGASVFFATSTDGLIWTSSSNNPFSSIPVNAIASGIAPIHNSFTNIKAVTVPATSTYAAKTTFDYTINNEKTFVAIGGGGIARSPDGITWTASSNNPFSGGQGSGVAWNGTYFLAVGGTSPSIVKSPSGVFWTAATDDPFSNGYGWGVAWNGSYWVAVGYNSSSTVCIAKSTNGLTWTNATDNPFSGAQGQGIAWNGSYWVAVGYNSSSTVCIAKSTNGLTWTDASNNPFSGGSGSRGRGISWNGTYWVAVGDNTGGTVTIAKSTDGLTWTNATDNPFSGGSGKGIAWNGSYWVAVGYNTGQTVTIAKSTDGLIWTNATDSPFTGSSGYGITWNGSYWVAVGANSGNTVFTATSSNGLTWTNGTGNPFSGPGYGIVYTTAPFGEFPLTDTNIIPADTTVIIESLYTGTAKNLFLSGITGATDTSIHIQDTANNFIGKDLSGGYMNGTIKEILVYSAANTETQRQQIELYLKNKWYPDTYTPTGTCLWLDSADASNFTLSGSSVQVWKDKSAQATNYSQSYVWAQPLYSLDPVTLKYGVRFGADAITTGLTSATSPFGNTSSWSVFAVQRYDYSTNYHAERTSGNVCTAYKAVYTDLVPGWVAVGYNTDNTVTIATSTDGLTWALSGSPFSTLPGATAGFGGGIAWNGSYWVAVGANSNATVCIAKSSDGVVWTNSTNNPFSEASGLGVAWNGSYWVAVGFNIASSVSIAKSTDGLIWTVATNNPFSGSRGRGISWNGTYWVAVGDNTGGTVTIAKSTDGLTWTNATDNPFSGGQGYGIAWNGSYWVAVGNNTDQTVTIAKSTDGLTWTNATDNPFSGAQGQGIAWNGSYWVAVGNNTGGTVTIAKSTDGMTWTNATDNPFSGGNGSGIAWNSSYWVAVGRNSAAAVCMAKSTNGMTWVDASNNLFSDGSGLGIAYGNIRPAKGISVGTDVVGLLSNPELNMTVDNSATPATVEIHTRPVLTSQVVNSLVYNDFFNGTANAISVTVGQAMTTDIKLTIGYTNTLTPALAGGMRGYIYELIVFKTTITTQTRQAVEGYLAWKWGIQDLLATTHPYYLAPPQ